MVATTSVANARALLLLSSCVASRNDAGAPRTLGGDVPEEAKLRASELYLETIERLACGIVVVNADRRIAVWNDWMYRTSGVRPIDAIGYRLEDVVQGPLPERVNAAVHKALRKERGTVLSWAVEARPLLVDPSSPPHSVEIHALPENQALIVIRDASVEAEYLARLEALKSEISAHEQAMRRNIKGVYAMGSAAIERHRVARQQIHSRLAVSLSRRTTNGTMGALLLVDLDHFADVNRSVGISAGDHVLRLVGARLADSVRPTDSVARIEGDSYAILLDGIETADDARATSERLLRAFDRPFVVGDQEVFVSASIGVAVFPADDAAPERLLQNAQTAVEQAKRQGVGGFQIYSGELDEALEQRSAMYAALRRAVAQGEFVLDYQPQVSCADDTLIGVEALIRWHHPTRGRVPPGEFIPLLEESGLITQVGAWVLGEACRQGMRWRAQGLGRLRISVNVSPRQFRGDMLLTAVERALTDSGLPPCDLELEVTEGSLMMDVDSSRRTLAELKRMGVRIAIDDFGTGYSSLAYLRRFPVDTLKIDRDFTRNIADSDDDHAICKTIVSLGQTLELDVIAEGVETEGQLELLFSAGCGQFQGFFFARPMAAEQVSDWVAQWHHPEAGPWLRRLMAAPGSEEQLAPTVSIRPIVHPAAAVHREDYL